jgi:Ca2+-binding EF-hand superfamily protein
MIVVRSQDDYTNPPEDTDEGVAIGAHDYTGGDDDASDAMSDDGDDTEASNGDVDDDEVSDEDLKSVWEENPLTSEQIIQLHKKMDSNGDGKVSAEELDVFTKSTRTAILKKETEVVFEQTDENKDGKISLEELLEANFGSIPDDEPQIEEEKEHIENQKKGREEETEKFKLADVNKDNFLDKDELTTVFYPEIDHKMLEYTAALGLKAKDKDGDGLLTPEEFWGDADPVDPDSADQENYDTNKEDFAKLDLDKDGKLNLKEILGWESGAYHMDSAMEQFFHVADDDEDKHISREELVKAREPLANSPASGHLMSWAEHYLLGSSASDTEL